MHDHEFYQILDRFELSHSGYRKVRKGVKKRIGRHMQELGCRDIRSYLAVIESNAEIKDRCRLLLTVSISRFYRDRMLWQEMERTIFPGLIQRKNSDIHVWSAGCACGEEVYTIKIIWDRLQCSHRPLPPLRITATDLNPLYLEKAQAGVYTPGSLRDVLDPLRTIYFKPVKGSRRYRVRSFLKDNIIWQACDIFSDAPGDGFDIIFLRNNVLTYQREHLKKAGFNLILGCLAHYGFLVIGANEALPLKTPLLVPYGSYRYVFRRVAPEQLPSV